MLTEDDKNKSNITEPVLVIESGLELKTKQVNQVCEGIIWISTHTLSRHFNEHPILAALKEHFYNYWDIFLLKKAQCTFLWGPNYLPEN